MQLLAAPALCQELVWHSGRSPDPSKATQMDFLPYCTLSRLFLADLLPLKAGCYHHFCPNCKKNTAFAATGRIIWSLLEQCKQSMSQEAAPWIAPPSNPSLPPHGWEAFPALLPDCDYWECSVCVHTTGAKCSESRGEAAAPVQRAGSERCSWGVFVPLRSSQGQGMSVPRGPGWNPPQSR